MGTVRKATEGSIRLDFYYKNVRCREFVKGEWKPTTIKYWERRLARIELAIAEGTFDYKKEFPGSKRAENFAEYKGDILLLKDYLSTWLKNEEDFVKAATYDTYRKDINNRLIPEFGHLPVSDLTRKHVIDWIEQQTCSAKRLSNIVSPLRISLDVAVDKHIIPSNPLAGWKVRKKKGKKKKSSIDPFNYEEIQAIVGCKANEEDRLVAQFWFWTGLRTSELIALEWADIDFVNNRILIDKAVTWASEGPEEPKTEAGERFVELLPEAMKALQAQKKYTYMKGEHVFVNRQGERWKDDQQLRKTLWIPLLKIAGVRYRYPYQCRHTYVSMLLQAGEDIRWVSSQAGHASWSFTLKTYSRYIEGNDQNRGAKIDADWNEKLTRKLTKR